MEKKTIEGSRKASEAESYLKDLHKSKTFNTSSALRILVNKFNHHRMMPVFKRLSNSHTKHIAFQKSMTWIFNTIQMRHISFFMRNALAISNSKTAQLALVKLSNVMETKRKNTITDIFQGISKAQRKRENGIVKVMKWYKNFAFRFKREAFNRCRDNLEKTKRGHEL